MPPHIVRPLTQLGPFSVAEFMQRFWQRQPVLLRQALPDFATPVTRARLLTLARRDGVESRLVTAFGPRWNLQHGPFRKDDLPPRSRPRWTLLVQGVDRHDAAAHALLARFRFVPDARLDDLMASYASDGGGVGPHVDSYDVFLIQAQGRRRWRISRQRERMLVPGLPLAILARFAPTYEWVLEPGDVLYLPPGVAHEGVAIGECITCSIGFRAPRFQELVAPWHAWLEETTQIRGQYRDPGLQPTHAPARIPASMIDASYKALTRRRPTRGDAEAALLRALSEPNRGVVFDSPAHPLARHAFESNASRLGVALDRRTRMLYSGRRIAINGELLEHRPSATLRRLADDRLFMGQAASALVENQRDLLYEWYVVGWLHLLSARTSDARIRNPR